jgi:hypothetical protein
MLKFTYIKPFCLKSQNYDDVRIRKIMLAESSILNFGDNVTKFLSNSELDSTPLPKETKAFAHTIINL